MATYALPGIFVMGCLVYFMEPYVIRCPEQSEWNIRAEIRCQNITKYFCLYNYIHYTYEEGCTGPEWDIPGSKRVYSRDFNNAPCNDTRYQPIKFVTNGNSDCIFRKSLCTEEGQTLLTNGSTKTDSTCRCDYKQGYAFVTVPRNNCSCRPSEEDCSCYVKKCQGIGYNLSADYECTKDVTKKTVCLLMSENPSEDPHIDMAPTGTPREYDSYAIKRTCDVAIFVSICFFVIIVITICALCHQRLPRCPCLSTNQYSSPSGTPEKKKLVDPDQLKLIKEDEGNKILWNEANEFTKEGAQVDGLAIKEEEQEGAARTALLDDNASPFKQARAKQEDERMTEATTSRHESNYIKIAMVVLTVSPRAVRVQFDKEFHPVRLQSILNEYVSRLTNLKMKNSITQPQWNLLFPKTGEQPSSKDFDITLMICLLRILIPIDIMDRLPSATDTSVGADLSRMKYYRNIIIHYDRALVDDTVFESYWNDVTPAILRLGGNSFKVECDDWYGRNFDAKQRDKGLQSTKVEERLALVEELAETNKKQIELEQKKRKELVETIKNLIVSEQEKCNINANIFITNNTGMLCFGDNTARGEKIPIKWTAPEALRDNTGKRSALFEELAETNKKQIESEQEKSNPVPKNIEERAAITALLDDNASPFKQPRVPKEDHMKEDSNMLYRLLRPDESWRDGLCAKNPHSTTSVFDYVIKGRNRTPSKYISTCGSWKAVNYFQNKSEYPRRIAKIQKDKLPSSVEIIDLRLQENIDIYIDNDEDTDSIGKFKKFAKIFEVVLLVGHVPESCIELCDD